MVTSSYPSGEDTIATSAKTRRTVQEHDEQHKNTKNSTKTQTTAQEHKQQQN
jgi:hypothetical protein